MRPRARGKTETPRTMALSLGRMPIQSPPEKREPEWTGRMRGTLMSSPEANATRRTEPPVASAILRSGSVIAEHVVEFARVRRADADEGDELAGAQRVQPHFAALRHDGKKAGPLLGQHDGPFGAARRRQRDGVRAVLHRLALDADVAARRARAQRLFLERRFLHQPMGKAAQEIEVRAAFAIAPRPEPGVVRQKERDAALVLAAEDEKGQAVGARHQGRAARHLAPTMRSHSPHAGGLVSEPGRSRVTGWRAPLSVMRAL